MQDPAYEAIGDYRFSKWKTEPKPEELPRFSTGFFQIVLVAIVLVLASAKLVLIQVNKGNYEAAKIWGISLMVVVYGPMAIAPFIVMRKQRGIATPPEAPEHLPSHAIHVAIRLKGQNASRGRSLGWLWVDGEWLRFSGEGFDFKLRPSDIKSNGDVVKALLRGWVSLEVPKKISPSVAYITPSNEQGVATRDAWQRLTPALEAWTRAPKSAEPALHPPLRGNVAPIDTKLFLKATVVAVAFGTLLGVAVALLFPEAQGTFRIPIVMGGLSFTMVLAVPLQNANAKIFDKEVDRAQAS